MVDRSCELDYALGHGIKRVEPNELQTVIVQRRSLCASRDMQAGEVIRASDLIALRPCPADAYAPYESEKLIGKTLKHSVAYGQSFVSSCIA